MRKEKRSIIVGTIRINPVLVTVHTIFIFVRFLAMPVISKRKTSTPKKIIKAVTPDIAIIPKIKAITKPKSKATSVSKKRILREIKHYQHSTCPLIFRASFVRVVLQICRELQCQFRWKPTALEALQEAAEMFIVVFLSDANLLANHCARVTLFVRDLQLLQRLRSKQ